MQTDAELIRQYAKYRDETAFALLVKRYIDLVYATAFRLLGDSATTQDVTQLVFIELARKSNRLLCHTALAGWLHTTARHICANLRRAEHRRAVREQKSNAMNEPLHSQVAESQWSDVAPLLDDALHDLNESDRDAVVLRFLQGCSMQEVGAAIGLSENAARMRVDRALDKLRTLLAKRGITSTASGFAAALTTGAVVCAPSMLAATVAGNALTASSASISASVFHVLTMTKLKFGIITGVLAATAVTTLVVESHSEAKVRQLDAWLGKQADQIAALQADNQQLSNLSRNSADARPDTLRDRQQLRDAVATLRSQADGLSALQNEARQLKASLASARQNLRDTNIQETIQTEETRARVHYSMNLALALRQYASQHHGEFPTNFDQAAHLISSRVANQTNFSLGEFEICYHGSQQALDKYAEPGNIILVRQKVPWRNADGKLLKVYTFTDGHGEFLSLADGNFDAWEKLRIPPPESSQP